MPGIARLISLLKESCNLVQTASVRTGCSARSVRRIGVSDLPVDLELGCVAVRNADSRADLKLQTKGLTARNQALPHTSQPPASEHLSDQQFRPSSSLKLVSCC